MDSAHRHRFQLLADAREFVSNRMTGIGRVLTGLLEAAALRFPGASVVLATGAPEAVPAHLAALPNIDIAPLPAGWIAAEGRLTLLTRRRADLFVSPYPKLPLFGCRCPAIHIVHDVLDLTHPPYRKRLRKHFDLVRLKMALRSSNLTWYDSDWSLQEAIALTGWGGRNPKVRYPAVEERFKPDDGADDRPILQRLGLTPGYILCIGNGLPHKNLGILLAASGQLNRPLVFAGVSERNRRYWRPMDRDVRTRWISHVPDADLPSLYRCAFCLVQPSQIEGYGYPPLEAMACGVPAVVSRIPVLKETTGDHALSADPASPAQWRTALEQLENAGFRKALIQRGLKWVAPMKGTAGWQRHLSDIRSLCDPFRQTVPGQNRSDLQ